MSLTLTAQDRLTLHTAAYGAVSLMAAAGAAGSPHRVAVHGSIALSCATGPVGHVLAGKVRGLKLDSGSTAGLADRVLPALTAAVVLLREQSPAEADNFRGTVLVALEAATRAHRGEPGPAMTEMARKITAALDAA
jgi:hypothetical protein